MYVQCTRSYTTAWNQKLNNIKKSGISHQIFKKKYLWISKNIKKIFSFTSLKSMKKESDPDPLAQTNGSGDPDQHHNVTVTDPRHWCRGHWPVRGAPRPWARRPAARSRPLPPQLCNTAQVWTSVADPDPGSGAFLTTGSGIRNRIIPDPGSRIPDPKPIFLRA